MLKLGPLMALVFAVALGGCVMRSWETSYLDIVTRTASNSWFPADIEVHVPRELTVSEANVFAPRADIVWHGDPLGDRHVQVQEIIETAAKKASRYLQGHTPVRIEIEVEQFHAISDRSRLVAPSAVHNLQFKVRVIDANTGQQIVPTDRIRADFPAYTRGQALEADRLGLTQKVRITRHVENVLKGWLRQGPDPRRVFSGLGR